MRTLALLLLSGSLAFGQAFTFGDPCFVAALENKLPPTIGYWRFDSDAGGVFADDSGLAQNLTPAGILVAGKFNNAWSVSAVASAVRLTNITANLTFSAWVKFHSFDTGGNPCNEVYQDGEDSDYGMQVLFFGDSAFFQLIIDGAEQNIFTTAHLSTNTWHHVAVTYNNTAITAYVNGGQVGSIFVSGNLRISGDSNQYVGNTSNSVRLFDGEIDDLAKWNVTLTAKQIQQIYSSGVPIKNQL